MAVVAACGAAATCQAAFALGASRPPRRGAHGSRDSSGRVARQVLDGYTELSAKASLAGFQGSQLSLWTSFAVFVVALPGIYSQIQRTGQAKFIEKTYVMPGTAQGGLEMRSIAGGVVAHFQRLNYKMEDSKSGQKIRFVGNMQGSVSQALYLTMCLAGALFSLGIVSQSLWPDGPLGFGPNAFFVPILISPYAGWFYWGRAFRKDFVELTLEMSEDKSQTTLSVLGDQETVEALQTGVRFMAVDGKLFQLMERGMEYQPGIFDKLENPNAQVVKEEPTAKTQVEAIPKAA